jgi:antibiotic biosynthesis monooxygenase (ABM) superfamily enzyme
MGSDMAESTDQLDTGAATAVITWDVRPGREPDFEEWAHGINDEAARHPGHQGATWLRAEGSPHRYYTIVNFTDKERLAEWLHSPERQTWMDRLDGIAHEHRHQATGLETWFSLPGEEDSAPPRWKMALVTLLAVYPLSLLFQALVAPATLKWPLPVRGAVFPLIMVPLLTYAVMPGMSRLFRAWLYTEPDAPPPATPADD